MSDAADGAVYIFSDGACRGNPGPGGWGVLLCWQGHEKILYGGEYQTTNNRMELLAAIKGLEAIKRPCRVIVITDSRYVQRGITEWLPLWKRKQWRTSDNKPVKNKDLWQRLEKAMKCHELVEWRWTKGHEGDPGNERADRLANRAIDEMASDPLNRD